MLLTQLNKKFLYFHYERSDYSNLSEQEKVDLIVSGQVHLVNIIPGKKIFHSNENDYDGVIGHFCALNWSLHKNDPSKHPMFRDLVQKSSCNSEYIEYDLKEAVRLIRNADKNNSYPDSDSHTMKPKGFVFHESRCGSTLAANALAAMEPSRHRVYSESTPPILALRACGMDGGKDCPIGTAVALFRDVVYVMGRTDDINEENLFFKIQSIGTKYIDIVLKAFPATPWIFIYRDPVQVMMSQLEVGAARANCVHQLRDVPPSGMKLLQDRGLSMKSLSPEEKCALHLVSIL